MRGHEDDNRRLITNNFQTESIIFTKAQSVEGDHQSSGLQALPGWGAAEHEQTEAALF